MVYDLVIIGGGLSGCYCAFKNKHKKILLIERKGRLGGRVKTIKDKNLVYEAGAARISESHKKLLKLIKQLNLQNKLEKLQPTKNAFFNFKEQKSINYVTEKIKKVIKYAKKGKQHCMSNSFIGIAAECLEPRDICIIKNGWIYRIRSS